MMGGDAEARQGKKNPVTAAAASVAVEIESVMGVADARSISAVTLRG